MLMRQTSTNLSDAAGSRSVSKRPSMVGEIGGEASWGVVQEAVLSHTYQRRASDGSLAFGSHPTRQPRHRMARCVGAGAAGRG